MSDIVTIAAPNGIVVRLENVVKKLHDIKHLNDIMQRAAPAGTLEWHRHETMDDHLHDALSLLGE